jgi:peroxiredoxin
MIRFAFVGMVALSAALASPVFAGEFNKKVDIGDSGPTFEKLPGTDGKQYSSADFDKKDVLVVCVTCNKCPVAVAYEDRMIEFAKKYSAKPDSKVGFVAINVNHAEADGLPKMKERADEKGFNFPYLYDESQEVGRALGASVTPEFFVLNKERKIVYMGAFDDDQKEPKTHFLATAVDAALKGDAIATAETRARGCGVKYEKKKRDKEN